MIFDKTMLAIFPPNPKEFDNTLFISKCLPLEKTKSIVSDI